MSGYGYDEETGRGFHGVSVVDVGVTGKLYNNLVLVNELDGIFGNEDWSLKAEVRWEGSLFESGSNPDFTLDSYVIVNAWLEPEMGRGKISVPRRLWDVISKSSDIARGLEHGFNCHTEKMSREIEGSKKSMNRIAVAKELAAIARQITGSSLAKVVTDLLDASEDVIGNLNRRTFSQEEWTALVEDLSKEFQKTKELKKWGSNFASTIEEIGNEYDSASDELDNEEELGIKLADLEYDLDLLKKVIAKHGVQDRLLHPDKYINRMRDFENSNRAYLSIIPKWLKEIMAKNEINIGEGLEGYFFYKGTYDGSGEISPEIEELVDLMNWAKSNKSKLEGK